MILLVTSIVASATSVLSLIPQIYRTYRLKSASDLSLWMLINFLVCSLSWVTYGGLAGMVSVWVTNVIMTIFSIILIVFKIRYTPKVKQCG